MKSTQEIEIANDRRQGYLVARYKHVAAVVAWKHQKNGVSVKGYRGKAFRHSFYYLFRNDEQAKRHVDDWIKRLSESARYSTAKKDEAAAKRQTLKASDHWVVGDVANTSWGYDQTNVDWYQVVEVLPRSVKLRGIKANCSDNGGPSGGQTFPRRNEFCGEPFLRQLDENGDLAPLKGRYSLQKWDGRKKYCSSNH